MIEGGIGGSSTLSGLQFEKDTDLKTMLSNTGFLTIKNSKLFYDNDEIGMLLPKNKIYKELLEPKGVDYSSIISKKLLPDEALYLYHTNTIYIIEKKWQQCAGSVDEKLQTCDFKKKQYSKLFKPLSLNVEYIYLLNDWFKKPCYKDTLEYILDSKCKYCFNILPLDLLDLEQKY